MMNTLPANPAEPGAPAAEADTGSPSCKLVHSSAEAHAAPTRHSADAVRALNATQRLKLARRRLDDGQLSPELVGAVLARSWQRSLQAGLTPHGRPPGGPHASAAQLRRALEQQHELLAHARPVMEFLHEQTRDTHSLVILAGPDGMLLHTLGDPAFGSRAERVALRAGATWHERWRGTNAIGTALAEGAASQVHAGEHFLERNGFLTCSATPLRDPAGRLLGVLDVSGDHRSGHRHAMGLVRSAARMIEHRLFETRHAATLRLRLHAQAEGVGTPTEALLALAEDGWLLGANEAALLMFGLQWGDVGARPVDQVLEASVATLRSAALRSLAAPQPVRCVDGRMLWMRVEARGLSVATAHGGASPAPAPRPSPVARDAAPDAADAPDGTDAPDDALSRLESGDPALAAVLHKARRMLDKPVTLLLHGEPGCGRSTLARAAHASSARAGAPFVRVHAGAAPAAQVEAEWFGDDGRGGRVAEAAGGTLFVEHLDELPAAVQARLLRLLPHTATPGRALVLMGSSRQPLRDAVRDGRFREDLYYRLNGLALALPPLRERQDLPALIERLLAEAASGRALRLSDDLAARFARYQWPGNLRQLANALRTAVALLEPHQGQLDWMHLPDDLADDLRALDAPAADTPGPAIDGAPGDLRQLSRWAVERAVAHAQGNLSLAARQLGISRNTLYRRLREAG